MSSSGARHLPCHRVGLIALAILLICSRLAIQLLHDVWGARIDGRLFKLSTAGLRPEFDMPAGVNTFVPLLNVGHGHGGQGFHRHALGRWLGWRDLYPRGVFSRRIGTSLLQRSKRAHFLSDV